MMIAVSVNGEMFRREAPPGTMLLDFLRSCGFASVKQGCGTSNCGLCTVWVDGRPILSCTYPAARAQGREVTTLEGVSREAAQFGRFMAAQGAEQCGYCSPGFIMSVLAMERELENPTDEDIRRYLAGNLCRCTGYASHMRALRAYLGRKEAAK